MVGFIAVRERSAYLHWCRPSQVDAIVGGGGTFIDGKSVHQDKEVLMMAQRNLATYDPPREFRILPVHFVLSRLIRKLFGRWNQIAPFTVGPERGSGLFFASAAWSTGTNDVTRQSDYFFDDTWGNRSGLLTVSQAEHFTRQTGVKIEDHLVAKIPGVPVELGVTLEASDATIIEGIGASTDPDLLVRILVPGGDGVHDLLPVVRQLIAATTDVDPDRLTDGALIDASDGYLAPVGQKWSPYFEGGLRTVVVSVAPGHDAEVAIPLNDPNLRADRVRTAYALRVSRVDNDDDFVIGTIVVVEQGAEVLRIRS